MKKTFRNPVHGSNFPDPFVLKHRGEYWAYGTGVWRDGRWFGVLRSRDLAEWEEVGGAVEPIPGAWPCHWAPEVSYHNGSFYLYYSLGDEATICPPPGERFALPGGETSPPGTGLVRAHLSLPSSAPQTLAPL